MKDSSKLRRSLAKAFCWESISFIIAILFTGWYLGSWQVSLELTSILFVIKLTFFLIHERIWHQIRWGKHS